jgi:acylphosphatase
MAETIRRRAVISGEVQGVNFRSAAEQEASRAGLSGWVRNRDDGTVEAVLEGESDAVEQVLEWCRSGPSSASVEGVEVSEEEPEGLTEFEQG